MPARRLLVLLLLPAACIKSLFDVPFDDTATSTSGTTATTGETGTPTTSAGDALCGNGRLDPGEQCDDGNEVDGDGCDTTCSTTPVALCGDGQLDPGEQCEDGNSMNGDGCENNCTKTPICGDGALGPSELCDDGNTADDDACLGNCLPAKCGDGIVWDGMEACDDGADNGTYDHCLADCSGPGPRCGDGTRDGPEECDDANQVDDDECSNDCVASRIVFVTTNLYNGNLGGIVGADAKCAQSAILGELPDNVQWVAWISDGSVAPVSPGRMDTSYTGYYKLTTGDIVAHGWEDLTDGALELPVNVTESKMTLQDLGQAWSNTTTTGGTSDTTHCKSWTSMNIVDTGRFGAVGAADATWTDAAMNNPIACTSSFHLYCFQNSPIP